MKNTTETVPSILLKDAVYVLRDLYLLAMADEKVQDNERALINKYAAQLLLTEEQQACVEKAVIHRLMSDSFWSNVLTDNCKLNP